MKYFIMFLLLSALFLEGCSETESVDHNFEEPEFENATVHDPSVIFVNNYFYVIGSHLEFAKSKDLIQWEQLSTSVPTNTLFSNVYKELAESFEYAKTKTLWAGDIIQLKDDKFYMYYTAAEGTTPLSTLGVAISDHVEGPYEDLGVILKSGSIKENGKMHDATVEPNVIDPHVFFDNEDHLWMVYGSYSGGIYILKMDESTGKPEPNQGYGKKLLGANHSRIEAPYILYSPETKYYYLFLSFGGLDSKGGYNIRVARSENPDGPYIDAKNQNMIEAKGAIGSFFDDKAIEPYGVKLIGNFSLKSNEITSTAGYVSPGHNSAFYNPKLNKYFLFFHTRFPNRGEEHEVRVHQFFFNEKDWPVIAPLRYAGETIQIYKTNQVFGEYQFVNHGTDISEDIKATKFAKLKKNGKISGELTGSWKITDDKSASVIIDDVEYNGVFLSQWNDYENKPTITFTGMSSTGVSVFGIRTIK
ncbi:glycoside hydrolase family 43 protein [Carnobacterium sp. 17-4]|uniref:glycoside hydrolase family 43 protein n=1 Tax=Carnobacterium sp. (strain 17-4) TaxID=208596 RepID=UPI0002D97913|nr:glycoside hydrolase family 43 protein [Carnobacterium sp. 17-4]